MIIQGFLLISLATLSNLREKFTGLMRARLTVDAQPQFVELGMHWLLLLTEEKNKKKTEGRSLENK